MEWTCPECGTVEEGTRHEVEELKGEHYMAHRDEEIYR